MRGMCCVKAKNLPYARQILNGGHIGIEWLRKEDPTW